MKTTPLSILSAAALLTVGCGGVNDGADAPVIDSLDPTSGPQSGGTLVTVTGSNFGGESHFAEVGGRLVEAVAVDSTTLTFTTPPGDEGTVDVAIVSFQGSDTAVGGFSYNPSPAIFAVEPSRVSAGDTLTIRGANLGFDTATLQVRIGGAVATAVQGVDAGTITATAGDRDVTDLPFAPLSVVVENGNGSTALLEAASYTAQGLFVTDRNIAELTFLDPAGGDLGTKLPAAGQLRKMTANATGIGFAIDFSGALVSLDLKTDVFKIGPPVRDGGGAGITPGSLAMDASGILWAYDIGRRLVGQIDLTTAVITYSGAVPDPAAATFGNGVCILDRDATTLFYVSALADGLRTISKADSTIALFRNFAGIPAGAVRCKALTRLSGQIFALLYDRNVRTGMILVTIDENTGNINEVDRFNLAATSLFATPDTF